MRFPQRALVLRFAAPAAFLAAVTIGVLLVHSAIWDSGGTTTSGAVVTARPTTRGATSAATTTSAAKRFYTIASGDTLNSIAAKFDTTLEQLYVLNPGIDAHSLRVGQKIRVA